MWRASSPRWGIDLLFSCTVGDNPCRLREALQTAFARSDLVITTWGPLQAMT